MKATLEWLGAYPWWFGVPATWIVTQVLGQLVVFPFKRLLENRVTKIGPKTEGGMPGSVTGMFERTLAFALCFFGIDGTGTILVAKVEIDRDPRAARPLRVRRVRPVAVKVERFFAWIRLAKNFEATIAAARAFLYAASVMLLVRRLARAS